MPLTIAKAAVAFFGLTLAPVQAAAQDNPEISMPIQERVAFDQARADILAMAGDYKVRFDMQESTAWTNEYEPLERKISGGHESIRVIEDTGDEIVLQHFLVVEHGGESFVVKHWRQDWQYEPSEILVYLGESRWDLTGVPQSMREGQWSQTVYQVDDSPRYGGLGTWETVNGLRNWTSNWTVRPLARRDAVRDPVFDRYHSINRHQPKPDGWIHWQDNTKMALAGGELTPIVQEYLLNTYTRFDDYDVHAADAYWAATADYWAAVREEWSEVLKDHGIIAVEEEAETGTVISGRLLELAYELSQGKLTEAAAIAEAQKLIRDAATADETPA